MHNLPAVRRLALVHGLAPHGQVFGHVLGINAGRIVVRKISEQAAAVGGFPPEKLVRERGEFVRPHELLRHEIIHARFFVDLRKLPVVPERVRVPADLHVHTEFLLKIALANQDLAHQRFTARHVEVRFDPHPSDHFPSALFHALLDLAEQFRIFFFHPGVGPRRRHGKREVGILAHQVQRAAKRVPHDFHGFRPGPEPGHVDVGVSRRANGEALEPGVERLQFGLRLAQRLVEGALVAAIETREADSFHRGVELAFVLRLTFGKGRDHWPRRENLLAQQAGIGTRHGGFNHQAAAVDLRAHFGGIHPGSNQELLSGLGAFR